MFSNELVLTVWLGNIRGLLFLPSFDLFEQLPCPSGVKALALALPLPTAGTLFPLLKFGNLPCPSLILHSVS